MPSQWARRKARRVPAILEKADARKRKERRKQWQTKAQRRRRKYPDEKPDARRRRSIESVLAEAGIQPGTVEAFNLLETARDENNRLLMFSSAPKLLRSYLADAEPPTALGWRRVPTIKTQRQRGDELDLSDRQIRHLNRDLVAAGFLRNGGKHAAGDGMRACVTKDGRRYVVPLDRRVWWLMPVVVEIVARAGARPSSEVKAGTLFPADLISDQPLVLDPSSSALCASSGSPPSPSSTPAALRSVPDPCELPPPIAPVSAFVPETERSEGAADAAPVDLLHIEDHPPLELATNDRVTERPTAAQRGGAASLDPPSVPTSTALQPSTVPAGCVPPPDPSTVRYQTGGLPPPVTPQQQIDQGAHFEQIPTEIPPASYPVSAFASVPTSPGRFEQPRSHVAPTTARRALRQPPRSSTRPGGQPSPTERYPERPAAHVASCVCLRCWVAASVRAGKLSPPPHRPGCWCPTCGAWRALTLMQWKRFKLPLEAARQDAAAAEADRDPTLQLMQRLHQAVGSGKLTPADHTRLAGLLLDGRDGQVTAELDELGPVNWTETE